MQTTQMLTSNYKRKRQNVVLYTFNNQNEETTYATTRMLQNEATG
jgi:hypothetical protein